MVSVSARKELHSLPLQTAYLSITIVLPSFPLVPVSSLVT